jgi:hypothetical protein
MTASSALSAARFFETERENQTMWFIPEWEELHQIVLTILEAPGYRAELARFCAREPHLISRYFNASANQRRQPDGDVALATLAWLTRKRLRWFDAEHGEITPPPPQEWRALERAFNLEGQFCKRRQVELNQTSAFAPSLVPMWDDLYRTDP